MTKHLLTTVLLIAATPLLADGDVASAKDTVMAHLRAMGQLDVDALVETYSDDAKIITPTKLYAGPTEIRAFQDAMVAEFSQSDISMETDTLQFSDDTALIVWRAESPDNLYEYAAETFVVEDGKIVSHTFAAKISPK